MTFLSRAAASSTTNQHHKMMILKRMTGSSHMAATTTTTSTSRFMKTSSRNVTVAKESLTCVYYNLTSQQQQHQQQQQQQQQHQSKSNKSAMLFAGAAATTTLLASSSSSLNISLCEENSNTDNNNTGGSSSSSSSKWSLGSIWNGTKNLVGLGSSSSSSSTIDNNDATTTSSLSLIGRAKEEILRNEFSEKRNQEDENEGSFVTRVHRQGPCAEQWRHFEECIKESKNNTTNVDAVIQPLQDCWNAYPNLYILIGLDIHQQTTVRQMELKHLDPQKRKKYDANSVAINFSAWMEFIAKKVGTMEKAIQEFTEWRSLDKEFPLWERYDMQKVQGDPTIITVTATVPNQMPAPESGGKNMKLKYTYALDQDNMCIGIHKVKGDTALPSTTLPIRLLPAMTKTVRVLGVYEGVVVATGTDDENNNREEEAPTLLYESQPISLASLAKRVEERK